MESIRQMLFRFRCLFMSQRRRYAYLWARTRHSHYERD